MKNIKQLSRSEMKNILAGHQHNICSVEVTCPSGRTIGCTGSVDEPNLCYRENDGSIHGYINCGVGKVQMGCWQFEPWDPQVN